MALRSELQKLKIGHPLVIMATDERGHTHDLKATFQGLTRARVKIRYVAGHVDSHCSPRKVVIKDRICNRCDRPFSEHDATTNGCPF
jgi:hypothetical protein